MRDRSSLDLCCFSKPELIDSFLCLVRDRELIELQFGEVFFSSFFSSLLDDLDFRGLDLLFGVAMLRLAVNFFFRLFLLLLLLLLLLF